MIWLVLTRPVVVGSCAAVAALLVLLLDAAIAWRRTRRWRRRIGLAAWQVRYVDQVRRQWRESWPLVGLLGLIVWSLLVVIGLATALAEYAR